MNELDKLAGNMNNDDDRSDRIDDRTIGAMLLLLFAFYEVDVLENCDDNNSGCCISGGDDDDGGDIIKRLAP